MSLQQIPLSAFKTIKVPGGANAKQSIKAFVESKKLVFEKGAGFYELAKPEIIQLNKRLLVQRISDPSNFITGESVKTVLGIDAKASKKGKFMVEEDILQEFKIFVQSTSYNRNLFGGTTFLYVNPSDPDPFEESNASVAACVPATGAAVSTAAAKRSNADPPAASIQPKRGRANAGASASTPDPASATTVAPLSASPVTRNPTVAAPTLAVATGRVEIVISFDTTASMYPCLSTVRAVIKDLLRQLTDSIPSIRIGILAHGDYGCEHVSYLTKASNDYKLCDASRVDELIDFVTRVGPTANYTFDECYELVLHEVATKFDWSPGAQKSLIMIGDATPHEPHDNPGNLDWRIEAARLKDLGIRAYTVHAMDYPNCDTFYREVAHITMGYYLRLHQFSNIADFLKAVCYREGDSAEGTGTTTRLTEFEETVTSSGRMVRNLRQLFDQLQGRAPAVPDRATGPIVTRSGLVPVSPTRFQVLAVTENKSIKEFALSQGLAFKVGRGFYEFTKPEAISDKKEVVLMDKTTGDFFTGWAAARTLSGIDSGIKGKQKPKPNSDYVVFVQSSSYNRMLIAGQQFLYEADTDVI